MGETKTITIRVPLEHMEWLESRGKGLNGAIVECIEKVAYIEKYAMRDLKGKFTPAEWSYIVSSLMDIAVEGNYRYVSSVLIACLEDANKYDNMGEKCNVDVNALCEKIRNLSCASIEAIYRRVESFSGEEPISIEY
ncbi:MAG: hypothetical protein KBT22_07445 [Bacteroidales bacterium]|nr:hypothetical protein [Candidatus Scybalocola fimicaballi]